MPFLNRVRLPINFTKPQFPVERNIFRKADGRSQVLSIIIRNTYEGKTDQLPEDWHRKLVIAMSHDTVSIESERLLSNVVLDGDYNIDHQDFLDYPIAQATFSVEVTPFNATNNNCQTCEELSQVVLVDDQTDEVWEEGSTNIFPDVLTDNDSICCRPYVISLVTWNTDFFTSVTIDASGVLTATVIDPAPVVEDVWIARYRVTCANGQYDEADVYGNITGTDENFCHAPGGVGLVYLPSSSTSATITLDSITAPFPLGWEWELFLTSDLGTVIQSGSFLYPTTGFLITGLTAGVSYTVSVRSDCGDGNFSLPVDLEFTITPFAPDACGRFTVTYLPYGSTPPESISYMDCEGLIQNVEFTYAQSQEYCMLITAGTEVPIYFVASTDDISYLYESICDIGYD